MWGRWARSKRPRTATRWQSPGSSHAPCSRCWRFMPATWWAPTRWTEGHAALVEDRADALLATGHAAEIVGELEFAAADAPLRERRWGQLIVALYRAGRQGEALRAYQRARTILAEELGVEPG